LVKVISASPSMLSKRAPKSAHEVEETRMERGNRHRTKREICSPSIGGCSDNLMVDKVEAHLDAAPAIRYQSGGEASGTRVEDSVPGMVHPRRARQPIFADNLSVKLERRARIAPPLIGNIGPPLIHVSHHSPHIS
jgi:hypothetical protein